MGGRDFVLQEQAVADTNPVVIADFRSSCLRFSEQIEHVVQHGGTWFINEAGSDDLIPLHVLVEFKHHFLCLAAFASLDVTAVKNIQGTVGDGQHRLDIFAGDHLTDENTFTQVTDQPNVILLPHLGTATEQARTDMALRALDNLRAFRDGQNLPDCVN